MLHCWAYIYSDLGQYIYIYIYIYIYLFIFVFSADVKSGVHQSFWGLIVQCTFQLVCSCVWVMLSCRKRRSQRPTQLLSPAARCSMPSLGCVVPQDLNIFIFIVHHVNLPTSKYFLHLPTYAVYGLFFQNVKAPSRAGSGEARGPPSCWVQPPGAVCQRWGSVPQDLNIYCTSRVLANFQIFLAPTQICSIWLVFSECKSSISCRKRRSQRPTQLLSPAARCSMPSLGCMVPQDLNIFFLLYITWTCQLPNISCTYPNMQYMACVFGM